MRNSGEGFEAAVPGAETSGTPSNLASSKLPGMTISHDYALPQFQQQQQQYQPHNSNGIDKHRGEQMERDNSSTSSIATDYFNSSQSSIHESNSPVQLSRSSSMASDHPWASMFPEGAAGAMTSMPRTEKSSHSGPSAVNMSQSDSSSSSFAGNGFKMPTAVQRLKSGGSFNSTSTSGSIIGADDLAKFQPIEANELIDLLQSQSQSLSSSSSSSSFNPPSTSTLLLDIRPSTSFFKARIRGSINICAPSTLLKRSGVTVQRIEEEMLSSERDQIQFSGWKRGPQKEGTKRMAISNSRIPTIDRIVVLDTDTATAGGAGKPSAGGGGPCLLGLLRKFDLAGYAGELQWLVGGFNTFSQMAHGEDDSKNSSLIDKEPLKTSTDQEEGESIKGAASSLHRSDSQRRSSAPIKPSLKNENEAISPLAKRQHSLVHPRGLPMEAFTLSTTTQSRPAAPTERRSMQGSSSYPTFDTEGRPAVGEGGGSACANPFFDNIRQNRELQHGITERVPLELPTLSSNEFDSLPKFLRDLIQMEESERTEQLARKFFDVEKAEQRRLIATMQQHAAESNLSGQEGNKKREQVQRRLSGSFDALQLSSSYCAVANGKNCSTSTKETFPFSIAAAIERGDENRYNNIWTFEHSRIRCADAEQYLNGSYLEPAKQYGCKRRYIATQAPLPSTFATFWMVMWQQNVRTICMVTREFESGRIQSHNYWNKSKYGDIEIKLMEELTLDASGTVMQSSRSKNSREQNNGGDLFADASVNTARLDSSREVHTLKRRFSVTKDQETREIVHLQFVAWPDFSIPEDAKGILKYINMASIEQHGAEIELRKIGIEVGPLVVHCSAGVGRTGTYVVIDSVLDVLRRLRRAKNKQWQSTDIWNSSEINITSSTDVNVKNFDEDTEMLSPGHNPSGPFPLYLNQPRRSLKRELSPSAMEVAASSETERRNSLANNVTSASKILSPTSMSSTSSSSELNSGNPPASRRGRSDEIGETTSIKSGPISSPLRKSTNGLDTPSSAMGSMKIDWDSSKESPLKFKNSLKGSSSLPDQMTPPSFGAPEVVLSPTSGPPSAPAISTNQGEIASSLSSSIMPVEQIDLIQKAVETIREQRMSTVQTARQFVFAYRAVIEGVLQEIQRERK